MNEDVGFGIGCLFMALGICLILIVLKYVVGCF